MELPLFNSILFRELRPGQIDATDRKKFLSMVKTANAASPANADELLSQLSALLSDFPELRKAITPPTAVKVKLQPLLFGVPLPQHSDHITQFYSLLIQKETLRVSNLLAQQIAALPDELVKPYDVKQALKSVRVLAAKTAKHLREGGFSTFPDGSSLEHFVFFTLKQMLSALFFEIQERFRDLLTQTETPESFPNNYLQEPYPLQLKPTTDFFELHINRLIPENKFSEPDARDLLTQIPQDAKCANLQAALENMIFLRSQDSPTIATLDQLTSQVFVAEHFSLAKQAGNAQLQSLQYGHERLDAVNGLLDKLDYLNSVTLNKLSIPQLLRKWLSEQKEIYTARFTEKFRVTAPTKKRQDTNGKPAKPTFGFHGDPVKLKTTLSQLCSKFDLVNDEKNNADELFALLTSKDLNRNATKIFINCETTQFRYIMDKLSPQFSSFNPKAIGNSELFYSKSGTRLNAQNLYASKSSNPKEKENIDKVLRQLQ